MIFAVGAQTRILLRPYEARFTNIFVRSYIYESPDILRSGGYCPFECFGHIMVMDFAISNGCGLQPAAEGVKHSCSDLMGTATKYLHGGLG